MKRAIAAGMFMVVVGVGLYLFALSLRVDTITQEPIWILCGASPPAGPGGSIACTRTFPPQP